MLSNIDIIAILLKKNPKFLFNFLKCCINVAGVEVAGTRDIVILEEIGGTKGEKAAEYIREHVTKPVFVYIVGKTAPRGQRMGHAGAITEMGMGDYVSKRKAFEKIEGVTVVDIPEMIVDAVRTYV